MSLSGVGRRRVSVAFAGVPMLMRSVVDLFEREADSLLEGRRVHDSAWALAPKQLQYVLRRHDRGAITGIHGGPRDVGGHVDVVQGSQRTVSLQRLLLEDVQGSPGDPLLFQGLVKGLLVDYGS